MQKLDPATRRMIEAFKPCIATALFATESCSSKADLKFTDQTEGVLSPGLKHEAASDFKFSNFGKLVKPTPFQTFSTKTSLSCEPQSFSISLSPIEKVDDEDPLSESLQDDLVICAKTSNNNDQSGIKRLKSILKSAENSRFNQDKK